MRSTAEGTHHPGSAMKQHVSSVRRSIVLGVAAVTLLGGAGASSAAQQAQDRLVIDNPANYTPQVLDGEVDAIAQVGDTVIIGGLFSSVQEVGATSAVTRNNIVAFNRLTGKLSTTFLPALDGTVRGIAAAPDGKSIYIGGSFNSVNGVKALKVAQLDATTGAKVASFNPPNVNAIVRDVKLQSNRLFIAGEFTAPRNLVAELSPSTGAVQPFTATFAGTSFPSTLNNGGYAPAQAAPLVYKIDLNPGASKLAVVGNFATVNTQDRNQLALFDLIGPTTGQLSNWQTNRFRDSRCYNVFSYIPRDVEFSPDGSYFVVGTTGGYGQPGGPAAKSMCDSVSRWNSSMTGSDLAPTWVDYSGGDSTYTVGVTGAAIYTGGHTRWFNNPFAGDAAGPGAVPREGISALDPTNGLPLSFNPGRVRGQGVFAFLATSDGLWVGSDTAFIGGENHGRIALLPLATAGTKLVPQPTVTPLPVDVYRAGAPQPAQPQPTNVLYRLNAGGPALAAVDGGPAWSADDGALRNTGSNTSGGADAIMSLSPDVPSSTPWALYSAERWDPGLAGDGQELQYHFPVPVGKHVQVRVYMGNQCGCTSTVGSRVFSATIDGSPFFTNLDLVGTFGHRVGGVVKNVAPITSDGSVDITFLHNVENPLVNGIEIIDADAPVPSTAAQDTLSKGRYAGSDADPAAAPTSLAPGGAAWSTTRGAFTANGKLYTADSRGGLSVRTITGTAFGAARAVALNGLGAFAVETQSMTGLFYENGRIFFTLAGDPNLYSRYFTTEDEVVGAERFVVTGGTGTAWQNVAGMFLASNNVYTVDAPTGRLNATPWTPGSSADATGGSPSGTVAPAAGSLSDWRARALFTLPAAAVNTPPKAVARVTCGGATCTFDGSGSTDPGGSVSSWTWSFGDSTTATGQTTSHTYATSGSYPVTLTVTDAQGASATDSTQSATVVVPPTQTISFVGASASTQTASASTFTTSVPAGAQAGDGMLLSFSMNTAVATTPAVPVGWTLVKAVTPTSARPIGSWIWQKVAMANEANVTVTVTPGATNKGSLSLVAYRGTNATSPVADSALVLETVNRPTHTTPVLTTSTPGGWVVSYWADKSGATQGWTAPAGQQTRTTFTSTLAGHVSALVTDGGQASTGPVGGITATGGDSELNAVMGTILLVPAP